MHKVIKICINVTKKNDPEICLKKAIKKGYPGVLKYSGVFKSRLKKLLSIMLSAKVLYSNESEPRTGKAFSGWIPSPCKLKDKNQSGK